MTSRKLSHKKTVLLKRSHSRAMELSTPDGLTIKTEPGTRGEGDGSTPATYYVEIEVPNIKVECLEYFDEHHQTDGKINNFSSINFVLILN